jgi:hypothetical protein
MRGDSNVNVAFCRKISGEKRRPIERRDTNLRTPVVLTQNPRPSSPSQSESTTNIITPLTSHETPNIRRLLLDNPIQLLWRGWHGLDGLGTRTRRELALFADVEELGGLESTGNGGDNGLGARGGFETICWWVGGGGRGEEVFGGVGVGFGFVVVFFFF